MTDTERLDWLEKWLLDGIWTEILLEDQIVVAALKSYQPFIGSIMHSDLRLAIDAAVEAEK